MTHQSIHNNVYTTVTTFGGATGLVRHDSSSTVTERHRGISVGVCRTRLSVALRKPSDAPKPHSSRRQPEPLQKWRMKRVVDFIDAHLDQRISLPQMATTARLTRMYFAAQFRAATGVRPHDYLLRRRIDRACTLLRESQMPLVEIALSVGFQTQAHFTTVFKRFTGETPCRWRCKEVAPRSLGPMQPDS
jgi:AraC family transcriptional regulator